jgi:hypothetical protein
MHLVLSCICVVFLNHKFNIQLTNTTASKVETNMQTLKLKGCKFEIVISNKSNKIYSKDDLLLVAASIIKAERYFDVGEFETICKKIENNLLRL